MLQSRLFGSVFLSDLIVEVFKVLYNYEVTSIFEEFKGVMTNVQQFSIKKRCP